MNLVIFRSKLDLMKNYAYKLQKENVPMPTQKILLKTYAHDLKINLTSKMLFEILANDSSSSPTYQVN